MPEDCPLVRMLALLGADPPDWEGAEALLAGARGRCRRALRALLALARGAEEGRKKAEEVAFRDAVLAFWERVLATGLVRESFYTEVLDLARRFVPGAEAGSILVREDDRFVFKALWNHPEALFSVSIPVAESWDAQAPGPGILRPPPEEHLALRALGRTPAIAEVLRVPVTVAGEVALSLNLDAFRPGAFRPEDVQRMELLATTLGLAFGWLKKAEEAEHHAYHDFLTRLPNERFWHEVGGELFARLEPGTEVAVLALDVARLRAVNESMSHAAGDRLLAELARRLKKHLFQGDLLVRMAGDEFAALLLRCDREGAERAVRRLLAATAEPLVLAGRTLRPRVALGVAVGRAGETQLETLWHQAALALRRAREEGSAYAFFDPGREEARRREERTLFALEEALAGEALEVHLQPIWDLVERRFSHAEALLRWREPPSVFVPLAESQGLGPRMDAYVLERAARLARRHRIRVWVNLLPSSLADPAFAEALLGLGEEARLGLEVTEYALVDSRARRHLERFARAGYPLALDDFGTGYASLSLLVELPFTWLKLDRSLIAHFPAPKARRLVAGVAAIARDLGLALVAEGVEDRSLLGALTELGFRYAQGYGLARPGIYPSWPEGLRTGPDAGA